MNDIIPDYLMVELQRFVDRFSHSQIDSDTRDVIDVAFNTIESNILRYSVRIVGAEIWMCWFPTTDTKVEIIFGSGGATVSVGEAA